MFFLFSALKPLSPFTSYLHSAPPQNRTPTSSLSSKPLEVSEAFSIAQKVDKMIAGRVEKKTSKK